MPLISYPFGSAPDRDHISQLSATMMEQHRNWYKLHYITLHWYKLLLQVITGYTMISDCNCRVAIMFSRVCITSVITTLCVALDNFILVLLFCKNKN